VIACLLRDSTSLTAFFKGAAKQISEYDYRAVQAYLRMIGLFMAVLFALIVVLYILSFAREELARIPVLIQVVSCLIIGLAALLTRMMLAERAQVLQAYSRFLTIFQPLPALTASERVHGIGDEKVAALRKRGRDLKGPSREWWGIVEDSLEICTRADGRRGWFILRPVPEILNEERLVWALYNGSYYQAVPAILTALGLLATFIAILQGLAGVRYNPLDTAHPISGIDSLINGLSGKFVTSIVALMLSVAFTLVEKRLCERTLLQAHASLVTHAKEAIPYLSESRILLDIQTSMVRYLEITQASPNEAANTGT